MSLLELKSLPFPSEGEWKDVRGHPKFCLACLNIHSSSISTMIGTSQIRMNQRRPNADSARREAQLLYGIQEAEVRERDEPLPQSNSWSVEISLVDLLEASESRCATCFMLKETLTKISFGDLNFKDPKMFLNVVLRDKHVLRVKVMRESESSEDETDFGLPWEFRDLQPVNELGPYELYTLPGSPCPWPTVGCLMSYEFEDLSLETTLGGLAGHVTPDPISDTCFNKIKKWIEDCGKSHIVCEKARKKRSPHATPERLVNIGPESNASIILMETSIGFEERYVALSHCWGEKEYPLSQELGLVSYMTLPQTIQDAIVICRKLEFQYMWIDALCIEKDDEIDWEIEAAKMTSVYTNADLVLAATGAVDDGHGCLQQRRQMVSVSGKFPNGMPYEIFARQSDLHSRFRWLEDELLYVKQSYVGNVEENAEYPLMNKAWGFTERLLATRMLHFTKYEVVFDCLTGIYCECGALLQHQDASHAARRILKTGHEDVSGSTSKKPGEESHYYRGANLESGYEEFANHNERWRDLVVQYSQTKVCKTADRLRALAGIASLWANSKTGTYLAGLWEKDLLNHLRWYVDEKEMEDESNLVEVSEYIAPSWSWVSVNRGVSWGNATFNGTQCFVEVDFHRTRCDMTDINPFGVVTSGHICLTGKILKVNLLSSGSSWFVRKEGSNRNVHFDRPDSTPELEKIREKEVFCLRFCTKTFTRAAYDDDCALVLVKAETKELERQQTEVRESGHVYKRVGLTLYYPPKEWNHDEDATKLTMYLI